MGEVITFTSGKGGVGKTTTTANIGTGLSLSDKRVVLIDTDIGLRNLDVVMGLENRILYNLVDLLTGQCRIRQALIRDRRYPNLYIIPSSCTRETRDILSLTQMKALLTELKNDFDYILIDSPAGIGPGFSMATEFADRIIVVTTPQVTSMHDADCVISLLKKYEDRELSLLINCFSAQMVRAGNQLDIRDIRELLATDIAGVVYSDENIIIAQNQGIPLFEDNTPAAYCYRRIVRRLLGDDVPIPDSTSTRRWFFRRGRCYNEA